MSSQAPSDGGVDEETEALRAWAREWARRLPPWSDEKWARINATLGRAVRTGRGGASGSRVN